MKIEYPKEWFERSAEIEGKPTDGVVDMPCFVRPSTFDNNASRRYFGCLDDALKPESPPTVSPDLTGNMG